jgi:nucleoside-diphosphate-sugar epimerase
MKALVTGSAGLIGSEAAKFFAQKGFEIVGIDNNMRSYFFGEEASTEWNRKKIETQLKKAYTHYNADIRDNDAIKKIFKEHKFDLIIHTAAQPSHDWAAREPFTDFTVNANGTLVLLENMRQHCPDAVFIFTSTNKVYGDRPHELPLIELEKRWEQVRDNIHSHDLVNAFYHFYKKPQAGGQVYNIGGARNSNISMLEAIDAIEKRLGKKANFELSPDNRIGDHIWYISDVSKFKSHYPKWDFEYDIDAILDEMCAAVQK